MLPSKPKRRVVLFTAITALAFALAAPGARALASDIDPKAKVLVDLDDQWSKTAATKDAAKVAAFYADDAIAYPPNDVAAVGREAAQKVWAGYFAAPDFAISWKTTHAGLAKGGDMGFTAGTYEDSFTGADGKTVKEVGKYVCLWKKTKDGWKAVHDIWNSDTR